MKVSTESVMFFGLLFSGAMLSNPGWAQSRQQAYLLPAPVHLSGIVTDPDGKPLPETWIQHTGIKGQAVMTNAEGRFDVQIEVPAIVFRRKGFNGRYYRVTGDADIEIQLEPISRGLEACSPFANCARLDGFETVFCFPKVRGVRVTRRSYDIDYVKRYFLIRTTAGTAETRGIRHGGGPMWGDGAPQDEDVWSAVEYRETDYPDPEGLFIVDARGKAPDGKYWRVLGHSFESAAYRDLSADETPLLDKVLDGVCLLPYPPRE